MDDSQKTFSDENLLLLELLKRRGVLSTSMVKSLHNFMLKWNVEAYKALVETHTIDETRLADILGEEFKLTRILRLRSRQVDKNVLNLMSYNEAMMWDVFPFSSDDSSAVNIAISDPTRQQIMGVIRGRTQKEIIFQVAERSEIEASIQRHFPLAMQLPLTMAGIQDALET